MTRLIAAAPIALLVVAVLSVTHHRSPSRELPLSVGFPVEQEAAG